MKQLSLKAKLTLLYSVIMVVIFSITLGILFYFSSNEILTSTRSMLEERVSSSFDSVEYRNDRLEYDNDLLEIQDGVYLSVYDRDGQMLYGKIPYDFDAALPVEEGNVRRIDTDGVDFFVLDMSFPVENYGTLQMRGIVSITDAESSFRFIMQLALILFPLLIVFSAIAGYLMSRRALSPVEKITQTVRNIQQENDLSRRVHLKQGSAEIYTLAETFDSMLDTIEAGLKRERQFSSDVSHELRTPLSVLQMQCDAMLERDDLDDQTRTQIEVLQRKIKNLSSMISQLLLLSRADRGQEKLQKEDLDLSELAEMLTEEYEEIAAERHLTLQADIQPDIHMYADQTLMIRLFANLLQNAVTYNRERGTITLTLKQEDDIILTVQDTGIGISEEHLPHIWERFYQADPSRSDTESSGLGLSMVKWIVEAHQGTITVSSKVDEGTTFTCVFPKQRTQK